MTKEYKFLKSFFSEPEVAGSNSSGLGEPFLRFIRNIEKPNGRIHIAIFVDFTVEGLASDFRFHVVTKSLFEVNDPAEIVVSDIYDMYGKAIEDLRAFLDYKIGKNGVSTIGVPMPAMADVMEELVECVTQLHSSGY